MNPYHVLQVRNDFGDQFGDATAKGQLCDSGTCGKVRMGGTVSRSQDWQVHWSTRQIRSDSDSLSSLNSVPNIRIDSRARIQAQVLPHALEGKDIVGLVETGSGKTGAFCIPILQELLSNPVRGAVYAVKLAPTRELAFQIHEVVEGLGIAMIKSSLVTIFMYVCAMLLSWWYWIVVIPWIEAGIYVAAFWSGFCFALIELAGV